MRCSGRAVRSLFGLFILSMIPWVAQAQVQRDCLAVKDQLRRGHPSVFAIFNNLSELDGIERYADEMHIGYNSYRSAARSSERNIEGIEQNIAENRARGQSNPAYWQQVHLDLKLERDKKQRAERTHLADAIQSAEKVNQQAARFVDAVTQRMQAALKQPNNDDYALIAIAAQSSEIVPKIIEACLASQLDSHLTDEKVLAPLFTLSAELNSFARDGEDKVAALLATQIADTQGRSSLEAIRSGYLVGVYTDLSARAPVLASALIAAEGRIANREAAARRAQLAQQRSRWTSGRLENSDIADAFLTEAATVVVTGVREGDRVMFGGNLGRAMGMSAGAEVRNASCLSAKGGIRCNYVVDYYMTYMGLKIPMLLGRDRADTFVVESGQLRSASVKAFLVAVGEAARSTSVASASSTDSQRSACNSLAAGVLASGGNPSSSLQSSIRTYC